MGIARGIGWVIAGTATGVVGAGCCFHPSTEVSLPSCKIEGQSVPERARNPANLGQCCLPSVDPLGWSDWFQDGGQVALGDGGEGWWTIGDFNGDARPDLVTGEISDGGLGGVLVQLNQGNAAYASPVFFPFAAPAPEEFNGIAADLNGDGFDDLILVELACCIPAAEAQVVMNQRDGTFGAPIPMEDSTTLWSLVSGDANGDGILDLFTAGYGDAGVRLRIGSGDGTFQPAVAIDTGLPGAPVIDVTSLRANGVLDLVAFFHEGPDNGASAVGVALGDGAGHFAAPALYGASNSGWDGFAVEDFDGDGYPDVVVYNTFPAIWSGTTPTKMAVLHGNGDGTLGAIEEVVLDPTALNTWVQSEPFQGAGRSDLICSSSYAGDGGQEPSQINVYWRLADGGLSPPFPLGPPTSEFPGFMVSDLNGDGAKDILSVPGVFSESVAQVYLNACGLPPK
jgi:FG-GAP-like repeat/FG-GAP repeat